MSLSLSTLSGLKPQMWPFFSPRTLLSDMSPGLSVLLLVMKQSQLCARHCAEL